MRFPLEGESGGEGMRPRARVVWISTALATALACVVLLTLLGHRSLAMWDEGIYAEISREMLGRNPLVPTWNLQPWFEKPPLLFWITAGLFRLFGVTEFWARAASALSGVAMVAVLHRFLARRFDLLTAWASSVILLSTFGFLHVCRAGETDALLALWETMAVLGLTQVAEERRRGWLLFWLSFAAAVMTKGAGSVVLVLTVLSVGVLERWPVRRYGGMFAAGMGLFLAVVLPWHLAMWQRFGDGFTGEYFGLHVLQRASSQMEGHRTHAWYFLWVLLVSAPPWVLLYVSGLWAALRKEEMRSLRPLAIFALVVVLLFSAVQTRLPHYVAPAYPALSAVAAAVLVRWMRAPLAAWRAAGARVGWGAVAAGVWAGMVIVTAHARKQLHSPRMSNGMVTPDTHEPAALLKASRTLMTGYRGPLLLMAEPPIAPMTTAMFYARRPVVQVEVQPAQPQLPRDVYTWDPEPLEQQAGTAPRLMLVERVALDGLPADLDFVSLANSAHWEIGTVERRDAAQSAGAGPD